MVAQRVDMRAEHAHVEVEFCALRIALIGPGVENMPGPIIAQLSLGDAEFAARVATGTGHTVPVRDLLPSLAIIVVVVNVGI